MQYVEELGRQHDVQALDTLVIPDVSWCAGFYESLGFSARHWSELEDNLYGKYLLGLRRQIEEGPMGEWEWTALRKLLV